MIITTENFLNMFTMLQFLFLGFLFAWDMERREYFWIRVVLSSLISIGLSFLFYSMDLGNEVVSGSLNYLLIYLFGILSLAACYNTHFSSIAFASTVAYTVRHMIYLFWQLIMYVIYWFDSSMSPSDSVNWVQALIAICCALVAIPGVAYLYKRVKIFPDIVLPSAGLITVCLLSLFIDNVLNMFVITAKLADQDKYLLFIFNAVNTMSCFMVLLMLFDLVSQGSLRKEMAFIKQMNYEEKKQYELSKENINIINIKCHDLRHQIRDLKESGQAVSKEQLQSIEDAIRIYDTRVKTGNESLDVVLQEKSLLCKKNNIVFNCIIDGQSLDFMDESDIYSLFGNIVDNAIDSVMKLENKDERVITLKIKKTAGGVFAYEENKYAGKIVFKNGLPQTDKDDVMYHGYGLKSVMMTTKKYKGTMKINTEKNFFVISIYIPTEER